MWDWLVWIALAVAFLAAIGAAVKLGVDAMRFIRQLKRTRRHVFGDLDAVAAAAEAAGLRAEAAGAGSTRLTESLDQLAASRRQLAVLQQAFDEAKGVFTRITWLYPHK